MFFCIFDTNLEPKNRMLRIFVSAIWWRNMQFLINSGPGLFVTKVYVKIWSQRLSAINRNRLNIHVMLFLFKERCMKLLNKSLSAFLLQNLCAKRKARKIAHEIILVVLLKADIFSIKHRRCAMQNYEFLHCILQNHHPPFSSKL